MPSNDILWHYTPPNNYIYSFVYCNIGEYGDQFLLAPRGADLNLLQGRIIGNVNHVERTGTEYCRIATLKGDYILWAYYYVTNTGRSVGRSGIVYVFGTILKASLILRYERLFSALLENFRFLHQLLYDQSDYRHGIETLVSALNDPNTIDNRTLAYEAIQKILARTMIFECSIKPPRMSDAAAALLRNVLSRSIFRLHKGSSIAIISKDSISPEERTEIFNSEASLLFRTWLQTRQPLVSEREFDSDRVIDFIVTPSIIADKPKLKIVRTRRDSTYLLIRRYKRTDYTEPH